MALFKRIIKGSTGHAERDLFELIRVVQELQEVTEKQIELLKDSVEEVNESLVSVDKNIDTRLTTLEKAVSDLGNKTT